MQSKSLWLLGRFVFTTVGAVSAVFFLVLPLSSAYGYDVNPIHLEWRPATQAVRVDATVNVGLYAVFEDIGGDNSGWISAMDVILDWDSSFLELTGVNNNGPYDWLSSGFPTNVALDGLNDTWLDGDAFYSASSQFFGGQALATPDGLLVTTVQFTALAETEGTDLTIPADFGVYTHSQVIDGEVAGWLVQGDLGIATVRIVGCSSAVGDLDGDGEITVADIDIETVVQVLLNPEDATSEQWAAVNANCDALVDGRDIQPLVDLWLVMMLL